MNCLLGDAKTTANSSAISCNKISNLGNNLSVSQGSNSSNISHTQETCLICGDVASGKHYGLRSCEACKAFFKRTVQGKIEYSCPASRECEINKRRRKACQACRFQKCLNMGMLKEGVRLDRVRGGRQKYRRGQSPGLNGSGGAGLGSGINVGLINAGSNAGPGSSGHGLGLLDGAGSNCLSGGGGGGGGFVLSRPSIIQQSSSNATPFNLLGTAEANKIMTALINCEPDELVASSPASIVTNIPSTLSIQMKTLYILSDLFDRELVSLIGWAKQIPGFSENITLNDQMRLLQSTWAEVIALSIGYRSHMKRLETFKQQQHQHAGMSAGSAGAAGLYLNATPSPTSSSPASTTSSYTNHNNYSISLENTEIRLVFAKDLILDFKHALACGAEEIYYNCVQLIKRLDYLKITPKEYIILKAICLTNADVRLENPRATHQLRDLIMDTLYEATLLDSSTAAIPISPSASSSTNAINQVSSIQNIFGNQKDNCNELSSGNSSSTRIKTENQERPLSSLNQYSSPSSPPRPSSSIPSSSSLSSISSHNNNNIPGIRGNVDSSISGGSKVIINNRLNQVLLCLPVLRQIDTSIRKFWNDVRKNSATVPMNKLFEEMLDTNQRNYKSSSDM